MKHLIIIGAGGYGREMFGVARDAVGFGTAFDIRGFLDARADALDGFRGYPPVIGSPSDYVPQPDDVFVAALGDGNARRRCAGAVEARGGKFMAVVHRTAHLGPNVSVGEGAFVAPHVTLTADVRVGRHTVVFYGAMVGHDGVLGDYAHVHSSCTLGGGVRLGEGAVVYPGAVVLPRLEIGARAVVGAGSTVIADVKPGTTVFGSPARPIK